MASIRHLLQALKLRFLQIIGSAVLCLPDLGRGPAAAKAFALYVIATYTNIHLTLEDFFGEGDKTAVRSTVRVTVIATGQRVTYPVLNIMRWDGDMIAERWELAGSREEQA